MTLFFKEAIHNCARHAHATRVLVSARITEKSLELSIHDNGRGFDQAEHQQGWGLDSMKKRAEELGGELGIVSSKGGGTMVKLVVPLAKLTAEPTQLYKTSN